MSLGIMADQIGAVMLGNEWHGVIQGTFFIDAYEFFDEDHCVVHAGGDNNTESTGFRFEHPTKGWHFGPFSAIQAVSEHQGSWPSRG